jgi:hypothetical protein
MYFEHNSHLALGWNDLAARHENAPFARHRACRSIRSAYIGGSGRDDFHSKGMNARLQLRIQGVHYGTMLGEAAEAGKGGRRNPDAEMGLSFGSRARVPLVLRAFVNHFKMAWREFDRKFFDNDVANRHMDTVSAWLRAERN